MLVTIGMDTKEILANTIIIFWMHSFINGHKKGEYIFGNRVSIAYVTVFINPTIPGEPIILTAGAPPATRGSKGDSVFLPLIRRKVRHNVHKCATIHIVYHIANPRYNSHTIITQITYCTDFMLLLQIPKIVRCNVADMCNEKTHHSISIKYELNFATSWWIGKQEIMTRYLYTSMCDNCVR